MFWTFELIWLQWAVLYKKIVYSQPEYFFRTIACYSRTSLSRLGCSVVIIDRRFESYLWKLDVALQIGQAFLYEGNLRSGSSASAWSCGWQWLDMAHFFEILQHFSTVAARWPWGSRWGCSTPAWTLSGSRTSPSKAMQYHDEHTSLWRTNTV